MDESQQSKNQSAPNEDMVNSNDVELVASPKSVSKSVPATTSDKSSAPPDGGYGWVVAIASSFVQFFVVSNVYAFGVLYPVFVDSFEAEQGATAWIGSIGAALMTAIGIYVGALTDYYGDDKMVFIGAILIAVGYVVGSYSTELWHLYLTEGVIVGVGLCFGFIPAVGVVAPWFDKNRGLAMGISFGGCGIGQLAYSFITQALIDAYGWPGTLRSLAIINGVGLTVCSLFIKRFPPRTTKLSFDASWHMFLDHKFLILYFAVMINSLGLFTPLVYQIIYSVDKGVPIGAAVLISALCGIPSMLGRVCAGYFGGIFGDLFSLKVFMLAASIATFFWILCTTFESILAYSLIFAFLSGGVISIVPAVCAEVFGVESLGATMGLLVSSQAVGNLFATPIAGALFDYTGDYLVPILVSAIFLTVGTIILFAIPGTDTFHNPERVMTYSSKKHSTKGLQSKRMDSAMDLEDYAQPTDTNEEAISPASPIEVIEATNPTTEVAEEGKKDDQVISQDVSSVSNNDGASIPL